jgi:hypothetical protein
VHEVERGLNIPLPMDLELIEPQFLSGPGQAEAEEW